MTTETQTLVERARLTDDEMAGIRTTTWGPPDWKAPSPKAISEAQLAKFGWAMVDWLDARRYSIPQFTALENAIDLQKQLRTAGLERPA